MKFCKDCKYYKVKNTKVSVFDIWKDVHTCTHNLSGRIYKHDSYVVDSKVTRLYHSCQHMRSTNCGEEAKLFEPKVSLLKDFINFITGK